MTMQVIEERPLEQLARAADRIIEANLGNEKLVRRRVVRFGLWFMFVLMSAFMLILPGPLWTNAVCSFIGLAIAATLYNIAAEYAIHNSLQLYRRRRELRHDAELLTVEIEKHNEVAVALNALDEKDFSCDQETQWGARRLDLLMSLEKFKLELNKIVEDDLKTLAGDDDSSLPNVPLQSSQAAVESSVVSAEPAPPKRNSIDVDQLDVARFNLELLRRCGDIRAYKAFKAALAKSRASPARIPTTWDDIETFRRKALAKAILDGILELRDGDFRGYSKAMQAHVQLELMVEHATRIILNEALDRCLASKAASSSKTAPLSGDPAVLRLTVS